MTKPSGPDEPIDAEIVPDPQSAPTTLASTTPSVPLPPPDYDDHGVPSLDHVRNKIEGRYATSIGATELAEESPEARSLEEQRQDRDAAAKAKLDEIRRSLG